MASAADGDSLRCSFEMLPPNMSELRLVLLGNDQSLKNSVGNLLLGKTEFNMLKKNAQFNLFTQHDECVKISGRFQDKPVTVIYTPDQLLSTTSQQELQQIIQDIKDLSAPGPHVFLLLLQPEDFTEEHKSRLQSVLERLSDQAFKHSLVLMITHNIMRPRSILLFSLMSRPPAETPGSMEKYMRQTHIRDMIIRCRYRYMWMDHTDLYNYNLNMIEFKRKALFSRICDMLKKNSGDHLSPDSSEEEDSGLTLAFGPKEKLSLNLVLFGGSGAGKTSAAESTVLYNQQSPDCLRIALIGKTGSGKSSSGNTILGREAFQTKASQNSITKVCEKAEGEVGGRPVSVVDTPGLFDTTMSEDEVNNEILKCVSLLGPGPHVFLLVLQIGRFTPEEKETLELLKEAFGKHALKYTIILFTHGDKLDKDGISIEKYIKNQCDKFVQKLISDCGSKYHVFNNSDTGKHSQVEELIKVIDNRVKENEGSCYSVQMLLEAEMDIKKNMKKQLKEKEEKIKEMEEEINDLEEIVREKET